MTGSFDPSWARFELCVPDETPREVMTTVHVDVTTWQEGDGVHTIDMTVTITDPAFTLPPLHVQGTFCDWPYFVC